MAESPVTPNPIRVILVDDHAVVREGTRDMLMGHPHFQVVDVAESGENLAGLIKLKEPDIVLLDINLPGRNGLELLAELRPRFPELKIILFTAHTDPQYIRKGIALRADGYLSKTIQREALQEALQRVLTGGPVYSPDIEAKLDALKTAEPAVHMTPREQEILLQVAQGKTNQEIARDLHLSVKTVDTHVANLMKKVAVNNRSQLTAFAYAQGYLI